jgi:UDP-3-O-[3-hydroxymyristoyl] glucosamine N-acyltransferase
VQATVQQLATLVQGHVRGDGGRVIHAAAPLTEAGPDDITFLENERHVRRIPACKAAAVVLPPHLTPRLQAAAGAAGPGFTLIEVDEALPAFVRIVEHLQDRPAPYEPGVSGQASVHPSAVLGPGCVVLSFAAVGEGAVLGARCTLHPHAVVGRGCKLGDDVVLYPGAVLYDGVVLGDRVVVHANAVVGADGFGYRPAQGRHVKVPQLGSVQVGDDVEIGACTTIDRGTFQPTRIGSGTKIDNLVMVGHNCTIGQHNLLIAQVGVAGSCTTGNYVVLAGQVGVADHTDIGDGAVIGAGAGVHTDVPAGARMLGFPARPEREAARILASLSNLPGMCKDVRLLKRKVGLTEAE